MGFRTDGSSHENGIKNEVRVANKLEQIATNLFPNIGHGYQVILKGGTQNKADVVIVSNSGEIPISIKNKKSLKAGSYDYVNSSAALKNCVPLQSIPSKIKLVDITQSVPTVRKEVSNILNNAMKGITSSSLTTILNEHVNAKNRGMVVIISDRQNKTDYKFNFDDMPLKYSIENHTPKLKWGRGKTSAKIVFEDNCGNILDHNIRIRVVLNNGIKALMGLSKSNKSSNPVIKIQQDRVNKVIDNLVAINKVQTF